MSRLRANGTIVTGTPARTADRPARARRRRLWILLVVAGLLVAVAFVGVPILLRVVAARLFAGEWGGVAEVDAATWNLGRELRLRGARVYVPGQTKPLAQVERAVLVFDRSFLTGDPGKLRHGVFENGILRHDGEVVSFVGSVEYRFDPGRDKLLRITGVDGNLVPGRVDDWVAPITRITEAPGVRSDGQGAPLERIEVHETNVRVLLPREGNEPIRVPFRGIEVTMRMEGPKAIAIADFGGALLGGQARGFGRVDWSAAADWHVQINLVDLDLGNAATTTGALAPSSGGTVSAFIDLAQPGGAPHLAGAGWIDGRGIRLWDQPVMSGLLRTLGITAGPNDAIREAHARFHVDRDHVYADEMIGKGSPINLFGTGSVRLDGGELDVRFVPRLFSKDMSGVAVVGKPTQALLDIVNGQLVEVRATGSLSDVQVQVNPIAVISAPLRAFLSLFSDEGK